VATRGSFCLKGAAVLNLVMPDDQNILDIIDAVGNDLRHTESFRKLLRTLDDETARKIAKAYITFLYHALEENGANNNRA
jgi:hypothetical protein